MNVKKSSRKIVSNISPVSCSSSSNMKFLIELALNLRWSWSHDTDFIWEKIDPHLWQHTRNPWIILQTVSEDKIKHAFKNKNFKKRINNVVSQVRAVHKSSAWFQTTYKNPPLKSVAYFCMEFMLSGALPIYSGGLGNVAGDQLKAASDLGVPVIGVGLLYQQGYFHQKIDEHGKQQAFFPVNYAWQLPISPLRHKNGEWLRIKIDLPHLPVWLRAWEVKVGRLKLYLLDSNDPANSHQFRGITTELYGGGQQKRLMQELILGIGGWKLLSALDIEPDVCHLNEGHAAFVVLERAYSFMQKTGESFANALSVTRAGNLFTTHTAVKAGFDRFPSESIEHYLGDYAEQKLGISRHALLALGRQNPNDPTELFNMAYLAIRASGAVNGVSKLHAQVSKHLFSSLFPRWPIREVPVGSVTNGIHTPSWDSPMADALWTKVCGKKPWLGTLEKWETKMQKVSDSDIWHLRVSSKQSLIEFIRETLVLEQTISGESAQMHLDAKNFFNPSALTIGFARRFATYKRPDLLLHDKERFARILTNSEYPVQIVIAGKAHPADMPGQHLIQKWIEFMRRPEIRHRAIFLEDYDMVMAEKLVQGVDLWINTPRRPWEASGTSGMKVLVNGGLNLSELDGWWAEAYTPEVGWSLGDGQEHGEDLMWDAKEADELYTLLEKKVIPEFYNRNKDGLPTVWIQKIRTSMATLTTHFSTNRVVREYVEKYYLPAAEMYKKRAAKKGEIGVKIEKMREELEQNWDSLRFGKLKTQTNNNEYVFEIPIYFNALNPKSIRVELYASGSHHHAESEQIEMKVLHTKVNEPGCHIYSASVPKNRKLHDYTIRVVPSDPLVSAPLEMDYICWEK